MSHIQSVCVFCGSSMGTNVRFQESAQRLGMLLAERGIRVVYGGGNVGLMGILADAALEHGGEVIGVIPEALQAKELAHPQVQTMHVVDSMHTRKAMMADLADAFIALPGGMGTFEELCEILTWAQLSFHSKPIALLNQDAYYDPFLELVEQAVSQDFMRLAHRHLIRDHTNIDALLVDLLQLDVSPNPNIPTELL